MNSKTLYLILVLGLTSSSLSQAEIYKWVDDKGVTHFSDKAVDAKGKPISVDTSGSIIGSDEVRKMESKAARTLRSQDRSRNRKVAVSADNKKSKSVDHAQIKRCRKLDDKLDALLEKMKAGYSASESNTLRRKKRKLLDRIREDCEAS